MVVDYSKLSNYPSYKSTYLNNNRSLIFTTESNNLPLAQFKVTEGSPCIFHNEYDSTQNRKYLKLQDRHIVEGCLTALDDISYDERYRYVDNDNEYNILSYNGIIDLLRTSVKSNMDSSKNITNNNNEKYSDYSQYGNKVYSDKNLKYLYDYPHNLYQKSYAPWSYMWETLGVKRDFIYNKVQDIEIPLWWQSTFNQVCLINMILTGLFFGIANWIKSLYELIINPPIKSTAAVVWDNISDTIVILFCFIKCGFVYVCVTLVNKYEYAINIMQTHDWSDSITNESFKIVGESLISSKSDNLIVFKVTMLLLTFEVINYLTPYIIELRKSQQHYYILK